MESITDDQLRYILVIDELLDVLRLEKEPLDQWTKEKAEKWISDHLEDYKEACDFIATALSFDD